MRWAITFLFVASSIFLIFIMNVYYFKKQNMMRGRTRGRMIEGREGGKDYGFARYYFITFPIT